jgi:8-oxo-dGTP diphosphatase
MTKPNNVGVGVAIAVIHKINGKLLLLKRQGAHASGKWACPGGWIDFEDQSPEDACVRELIEEVGIYVKKDELQLLTVVSENHVDLGIKSVTVYYLVEYDPSDRGNPTIREPEKCSALMWVGLDIAHGYYLFPKLDEVIKILR